MLLLSNLPLDILDIVFQHVPPHQLSKYAKVCRQWANATRYRRRAWMIWSSKTLFNILPRLCYMFPYLLRDDVWGFLDPRYDYKVPNTREGGNQNNNIMVGVNSGRYITDEIGRIFIGTGAGNNPSMVSHQVELASGKAQFFCHPIVDVNEMQFPTYENAQYVHAPLVDNVVDI